ncbi:MAG: hypothetical protein Q4G34_10180, partial [Micrococcus sp.]|nr:hypothetical protein [Micrococcus sp.]
MATLLYRLGIGAARKPLLAIVGWALLLALGVTGFLSFGGTLSTAVTIPNTPTAQLTERLEREFPEASKGRGQVVFATEDGSEFTDSQRGDITSLLNRVAREDIVDSTLSPFEVQEQQQDATAQIEDGRAQLDQAREDLAAGRTEAEQGAAQIEDGQAQLDAGREELNASQAE